MGCVASEQSARPTPPRDALAPSCEGSRQDPRGPAACTGDVDRSAPERIPDPRRFGGRRAARGEHGGAGPYQHQDVPPGDRECGHRSTTVELRPALRAAPSMSELRNSLRSSVAAGIAPYGNTLTVSAELARPGLIERPAPLARRCSTRPGIRRPSRSRSGTPRWQRHIHVDWDLDELAASLAEALGSPDSWPGESSRPSPAGIRLYRARPGEVVETRGRRSNPNRRVAVLRLALQNLLEPEQILSVRARHRHS